MLSEFISITHLQRQLKKVFYSKQPMHIVLSRNAVSGIVFSQEAAKLLLASGVLDQVREELWELQDPDTVTAVRKSRKGGRKIFGALQHMGKEGMTYGIVIFDVRVWNRDSQRIPKNDLERITDKIRRLEQWPGSKQVNVKALQHYDAADFRLRVGNYRVLFNVHEPSKTIFLLRVLHRSKLY